MLFLAADDQLLKNISAFGNIVTNLDTLSTASLSLSVRSVTKGTSGTTLRNGTQSEFTG